MYLFFKAVFKYYLYYLCESMFCTKNQQEKISSASACVFLFQQVCRLLLWLVKLSATWDLVCCQRCLTLWAEPELLKFPHQFATVVQLLRFIMRIINHDQPIRGFALHCFPAKLILLSPVFVLQVLSVNGLLMTLADFLSYSSLIRLHRLKLLDLHVTFLYLFLSNCLDWYSLEALLWDR